MLCAPLRSKPEAIPERMLVAQFSNGAASKIYSLAALNHGVIDEKLIPPNQIEIAKTPLKAAIDSVTTGQKSLAEFPSLGR